MSNLFLSLFNYGLAAARPTAPALAAEAPATGVFYLATDTNVLSSYVNGAWAAVSPNNAVSVDAALTAGTTHTLAGATPITGSYSNVSVCANASDAVALPAASIGAFHYVTNNGAAAGKVWPQAADAIDGGSAGVAVTLTNAKSALFVCVAANAWLSIGFAGKSA